MCFNLFLSLRHLLFFRFLMSNFMTTCLLVVPLHLAHDHFVVLDCLFFGGFVTSLKLCNNILQMTNIELLLSQLKLMRGFDVIIYLFVLLRRCCFSQQSRSFLTNLSFVLSNCFATVVSFSSICMSSRSFFDNSFSDLFSTSFSSLVTSLSATFPPCHLLLKRAFLE